MSLRAGMPNDPTVHPNCFDHRLGNGETSGKQCAHGCFDLFLAVLLHDQTSSDRRRTIRLCLHDEERWSILENLGECPELRSDAGFRPECFEEWRELRREERRYRNSIEDKKCALRSHGEKTTADEPRSLTPRDHSFEAEMSGIPLKPEYKKLVHLRQGKYGEPARDPRRMDEDAHAWRSPKCPENRWRDGAALRRRTGSKECTLLTDGREISQVNTAQTGTARNRAVQENDRSCSPLRILDDEHGEGRQFWWKGNWRKIEERCHEVPRARSVRRCPTTLGGRRFEKHHAHLRRKAAENSEQRRFRSRVLENNEGDKQEPKDCGDDGTSITE
ncbi:MAG: hypothetical protein G01um101438_990 [Parcubacteria group bacterium Gr01-1014_38]|nr:MAG: hypothetical protein G01um101438_990 [Parcubacteria group bacterium Gr01-1014_38]